METIGKAKIPVNPARPEMGGGGGGGLMRLVGLNAAHITAVLPVYAMSQNRIGSCLSVLSVGPAWANFQLSPRGTLAASHS